MTTRRNPLTLAALALGLLAVAPAGVTAAPGGVQAGMQVEEPALSGPKPPIQPELDQATWKDSRNASLSAEQKAALKARQETMHDMVVLIQKKRRAIREARPEQKLALALELQDLILEKRQNERGGGRAGDRKDGPRDLVRSVEASEPAVNVRVREAHQKAADQKARQLEQKEEILRQQEARRRAIEEKLKQLEEKLKRNEDD